MESFIQSMRIDSQGLTIQKAYMWSTTCHKSCDIQLENHIFSSIPHSSGGIKGG
jgi:hypothetical protein